LFVGNRKGRKRSRTYLLKALPGKPTYVAVPDGKDKNMDLTAATLDNQSGATHQNARPAVARRQPRLNNQVRDAVEIEVFAKAAPAAF
jgi:hypothetical protein